MWLMAACSSIPDTEHTDPPPPQPIVQPAPPTLEFETRSDTVYSETLKRQEATTSADRGAAVRYMVQIGAFKDPHNASRVQKRARERYNMPVLNDFNAVYGLYQIRIGFFETKETAYEFRSRMQADYPNDYSGSWVVQLKR
jgi:cell division protein FtsN